MIPTIVVVNDNNEHLKALTSLLANMTRVFHRTSLEGEQLYKMFEGVIFIDENGNQQLIRKDNYTDVVSSVLQRLVTLNAPNHMLLKNYLGGQQLPPVSESILSTLDDTTRGTLKEYLKGLYHSPNVEKEANSDDE